MVTVSDGTTLTQCITVTDTVIYIDTQYILHKDFSMTGKEHIMDIFGKHYAGQRIHAVACDGENIAATGFIEYLEYLCKLFAIPHNKVSIQCHTNQVGTFNFIPMSLGIFTSVKSYLPEQIVRDLSNAKFIGTSLGRFNATRLRIAYEIDQHFPNDNYIIFQPHKRDIDYHYGNFSNVYSQELAWFYSHTFESDLTSGHQSGTIGWPEACRNYSNIWNQYCIEVVSETDVFSNYWFTEKTARCLATGKPFVLVAGQGSLDNLQRMGFRTFADVIDESYDQESIPVKRIDNMLESLDRLYSDPERIDKLNRMYAIAEENKIVYNEYIKS